MCLGTCVLLTPWVGWGLQVWSQKTLWPPRTGRCRLAAEWGPACTKISGNLNTQTDTHNHFSAQGGQPEDKNGVHLTWPQVFMSVLILILPCNAWFPIERTKAVLKKIPKSQSSILYFLVKSLFLFLGSPAAERWVLTTDKRQTSTFSFLY